MPESHLRGTAVNCLQLLGGIRVHARSMAVLNPLSDVSLLAKL